MQARRITAWWVVALVASFASASWAQEATKGEIRGTVKDQSGGVLPGTTVTAVQVETGETRTTVVGDSGLYRLPALSLGDYVVTAELPGFATIKREGITLGLGQALTVDFTLQLANVAESITVTAEAPLIDTTKVEVAGLLQPEQITNLPLMGRNWMELGFLMPGVTSTVVHPRGVATGRGDFWSQNVIIDGVDSREECCNRSNGTHSQEAIAEFKIISNNFGAEYGRSTSSVLTAVTKSGTNVLHGSAFYLIRDERLDKPDFFTGEAEPLDYYQAGGSAGGPILKDRAFFFGAFERQFDSRTGFSTTGFPELDDYKVPLRAWQNYSLAKTDIQFGGKQHLSAKFYHWKQDDLNGSVVSNRGVEGELTPWATTDRILRNAGVAVNHTWVGKDKVNEFTSGWVFLDWLWTGKHGIPVPGGFRNPEVDIPRLTLPSFTMGFATAVPQDPAYEHKFQFKDNLSLFRNWHGDHDLKIGADVILSYMTIGWFRNSRGDLRFVEDPLDPFDFSTYPEPVRFQLALGRPDAPCPDNLSDRAQQEIDRAGSCAWYVPVHNFIYAAFIQDNWAPTPRLNLGLGLRYEVESGAMLPDYQEKYKPQLDPQIPHPNNKIDSNNFGPRVSFSYDVHGDSKTVIQGGSGVYYGTHNFNRTFNKLMEDGWNTITTDQSYPTRQACFEGHTLEEAITQDTRLLLPGCGSLGYDELYARASKAISAIDPDVQVDRAIQSTIGFKREISADLAVEVNFVYNTTGPDRVRVDTNLFFDPETGGPKNPRIFGRPDPRFTSITTQQSWGRSVYKGLQVRFNKRFSHNYQFQANYTLGSSRETVSAGSGGSGTDNPFNRDEWGPTPGSSRHRLSVNGMVDLPFGLELSGVVLTYSGFYYANVARGDIWNLGRSTSLGYRQPDGTVVFLDKNSNVGDPFVKLDLRVSKWFELGGDRRLGAVAEFFNVLNRENHGSYGSVLGSRTYQQATRNPANQFAPRQIQLGLRLAF